MNVELNRHEIGNLLDRSADRLDSHTLKSLQSARHQALQRQRPEPSAWLNEGHILSAGNRQFSQHALYWIFATVVAALLLINLTQWHPPGQGNGNIDLAILTDEMPVAVYVD
ncbi:MAG: DUF3619 family protein [Gammaproteobacteria bacterium]|nr:DUF3619 family protein [Gammaproteobacteria bacterium]MBU1776764.1 DUF3619 family protein [Gammaproteobacteria bacterium]MBU1969531.1 DUF3619 family protein [Gammaproteobacteria bacterium]